jgi:hypothetical protein
MPVGSTPVIVDSELGKFLESGVSVLVGTRDSALRPEITRAWGPCISADRRSLSVCIPRATSSKTLENLEENGQLAVSFAFPTNYKTIQLKGRCIATAEPGAEDLRAIERHRAAFAAVNRKIGVSQELLESFWRKELETSPEFVAIRFLPEQAFDQTPGPKAGSRL